jgi:flagellar basal-body rod protein FlgC
MSLSRLSPLSSSALLQSRSLIEQALQNNTLLSKLAVQNFVNQRNTAPDPQTNPYQRRTATFKNVVDSATGTHMPVLEKIGVDKTPFPTMYSPFHPGADGEGMVKMANVNPLIESADFQEANLQLSLCSRMYETTTVMLQRTHDLMKTP